MAEIFNHGNRSKDLAATRRLNGSLNGTGKGGFGSTSSRPYTDSGYAPGGSSSRPATPVNSAGKPLAASFASAGRPSSAPSTPLHKKDLRNPMGDLAKLQKMLQTKKMSDGESAAARARVAELKRVKEADFWGRESPVRQDLPPFWSLRTFGQPYNDERMRTGSASQMWKHSSRRGREPEPVGPATEATAVLRRSLIKGERLFDKASLSPITLQPGQKAVPLREDERVWLINKLPPHQKMHALRHSLDRDRQEGKFVPWTQAVMKELNGAAWEKNAEQCIRLAVQRVEDMMRRHLRFLSDQQCAAARAPSALVKDIMRQAFWRVDPKKTGEVSLQQFLQVWQNVLQLEEYDEEVRVVRNKQRHVLVRTGRRVVLDQNAAAAIFVKYGFDKDGLMPYVVFMNALTETPSRLLGHELILDNTMRGRNGLADESDIAMAVADCKIMYPKCKNGVFPPSGFDPRVAHRSSRAPQATMYLEHVYGYAGITDAGIGNLANNIFYNHNHEFVYYMGMVGIVFNKDLHLAKKPSQRFFFGHNNDILCIAMHPNRRFVATGQQEPTGSMAYACVWDTQTCHILQRLDHGKGYDAVIACEFSGGDQGGEGGEILVTVTCDLRHSIHIWRWMKNADPLFKATYIPGWYYGPEKKLADLTAHGLHYNTGHHHDEEGWSECSDDEEGMKKPSLARRRTGELPDDIAEHPLVKAVTHTAVEFASASGLHTQQKPSVDDGSWEYLDCLPGYQGTPPTVYGVVWNPFRPANGGRGSEFASYGVKHVKSWIKDDNNQWIATNAQFGPTQVDNVLSLVFVRAMHEGAGKGDSCMITGFAPGTVGVWVPPYPTRPGAIYTLTRVFNAHGEGPAMTLNDGTQVFGGVKCLKVRADGRSMLSAGADGYIQEWALENPTAANPDGTQKRGVKLTPMWQEGECYGPHRFKLAAADAVISQEKLPMVTGLDTHPEILEEFVCGTSGCDIWEVDKDPRVLVEGHAGNLQTVAAHPLEPFTFATACEDMSVTLWDAEHREAVRMANLGFVCRSVTFSGEEYPAKYIQGWDPRGGKGYHIAVGGATGRIAILDGSTLQPLVHLKDAKLAVDEMKYSPAEGPKILAAGSHDLCIYLYRVSKGYQLMGRLVGHSGAILHLNWSLPVGSPLALKGRRLLQSADSSYEILYWDPQTGRQVTANQRDTAWHTWTTVLGFDVMGIWPDGSDGTDVNSVDRANSGKPTYDKEAGLITIPGDDDSPDGVRGASFMVSADDFSLVKLFNYPAVADDAPFRAFRGHSSFVSCTRFLCDDKTVITVGGADRSVFQWRTVGVARKDAEHDAAVLRAVDTAVAALKDINATAVPRAMAEWGPLDGSGKNFGPLDSGMYTDLRKSLRLGSGPIEVDKVAYRQASFDANSKLAKV
ncbi:hypothetical protein WJX72_009942 [[Myrmecia] bisecta]|uniref:EML-like second beta-propeller domain-containing protein n=1 Tax=[Myrmecia] bisecta TaxID=41462 RepID=A0AAW1QG95_9CHLO